MSMRTIVIHFAAMRIVQQQIGDYHNFIAIICRFYLCYSSSHLFSLQFWMRMQSQIKIYPFYGYDIILSTKLKYSISMQFSVSFGSINDFTVNKIHSFLLKIFCGIVEKLFEHASFVCYACTFFCISTI